MSYKKLIAGIVVVLLSSVVGVNLGHGILRIVNAKEKPSAKRTTKAKATAQGIKPAVASCPTIKIPPLSLFAQDYSSNEGLGVRHGDVESASIVGQISGLPDGTSAQITLTFQLSATQSVQSSADPNLFSLALSEADVYLNGAGSNFLIQGSDLISQGGTQSQEGTTPLPNGILQYNITVGNGNFDILANIEADAITSNDMATAFTSVSLDFVYAEFSGVNKNVVANLGEKCADPCGGLLKDINDTIYGNGVNIDPGMADRYNDLLYDKNNFYCLYHDTIHPLVIIYKSGDVNIVGSYIGHIEQYEGLQNRLNKLIYMADKRDPPCPVPPVARKWAVTPAPTMPIKPPCDAPGNSGPSPVFQ